jgi:Right handed beta helix region
MNTPRSILTRRQFLGTTALAVASAPWVAAASAPTRSVADLAALKDVLENSANPGDVILLQPGVYAVDVPRLSVRRSGTPERPITLRGVVRGEQRPVLDGSAVNVQRGLLYFWPETHDWVVENVEFRNARGSGRPNGAPTSNNAAAAYIQGSNLTFRNCYSHHNDNGWFSTHDAVNTLIEGCETAYNGKPASAAGNATHNHYVNSRSLIVRYCYIHHSTEAQNFKSRCEHAVLAYNWIEEDGGYSVEVASENEHNTLWIGNVIIKRTPPRGQRRLLGVGDGTGVARGTLALVHNTLVTRQPEDFFLFSHSSATTDLLLYNNLFAGPGRAPQQWNGKGRIEGAGNFFATGIPSLPGLTGSIVADTPGFVDASADDFRLRPDSPCRDAGTADPRSCDEAGALVRTLPTNQPRRREPGSTERRARGKPDIGAFEFS